jgi:hypothetical protein
MIKLGLQSLNAIEQGLIVPEYRVKVYFQAVETYTVEDYLSAVNSVKSSMSSIGNYEIGNASVMLKNTNYYFSKKFVRELPNKRRVEVYLWTGYDEKLLFSGIVSGWEISPVTTVSLSVNA